MVAHPLITSGFVAAAAASLASATPAHEWLLTTSGEAQEKAAPGQEAPKTDGQEIRWYWKDGFRMETADKAFSMRISGRMQTDLAFFSGDESDFGVEFNDGVEVRRAYLAAGGRLFKDVEYMLEIDFAKASNEFADAFLGTATPLGMLRVGHFKQPFSLEELTSDLHTTFMERSLSSAFKLGRDVGIQLSDVAHEKRMTWAVGVFKDTDVNGKNQSGTSDDEYSFTGRLTYVPWRDESGDLVHIGASASLRNPSGNTMTFSAKPEANLAPSLLSSGVIGTIADEGDEYQLYGIEAAWVHGSLSLQGEYMTAETEGAAAGGDDPTLNGYYAFVSYFLTGEQRAYRKTGGVFDRVKPKENFSMKEMSGSGAWELGLRYTKFDFDEASATDANLSDVTLGVNWYWNAFSKIQFNVVNASLESGAVDEDATIYQMRFHFDF
jgi:phosphate-selective porin OprO/OprP